MPRPHEPPRLVLIAQSHNPAFQRSPLRHGLKRFPIFRVLLRFARGLQLLHISSADLRPPLQASVAAILVDCRAHGVGGGVMAFDPEKDGASGVVDGFCELGVPLIFDQAADGGAEGGEHGEDVDPLRGGAEGIVLE